MFVSHGSRGKGALYLLQLRARSLAFCDLGCVEDNSKGIEPLSHHAEFALQLRNNFGPYGISALVPYCVQALLE